MVGDRFPRASGETGSGMQTAVADVLVTGAELLDRIERQADETARLRVRLDAVESALDAERKTRRHMGEMLEREREARGALDRKLGIAERELAWARRPLWRKALRRPPREEAD